MAKYDKNTKFYWLQLKEDFFDDDAIQWLEEQKPNGRDYAYFYLKLCLKSLRTNGILIRNVGEILIPYDNEKLAELTKIDFDTVTVAMELLKKIGLVKILGNGEIYISQIESLIGKKSIGAFKKQQQRMLGSGQEVDNCPPDIEIELEIEKEIEIDKDKTVKNESKKQKNKNDEKIHFAEFVAMTNTEYEKLVSAHGKKFADQCITILDNYKGSKGKRYKNDYRAILSWVVDKVQKEHPNLSKPKAVEYKENTMTEEEYLKKLNKEGRRYV